MTEQIEVKPKNKGGRPKKDKKGILLWVAADYADAMQAFLETLKQQSQKQAKTS
jgi:hypothetical protein